MPEPRVGIGVIIVRDDKVLLGKRKSSHGKGTWCPPGGHLEHGETPEDCARRETLEETGLDLASMERGPWTNDLFESGKHYVTLHFVAEAEGTPEVREPDKLERWEWFSWDDLPEPLFLSTKNLKKSGFRPC